MSELKEYYDYNVNRKQIDISAKVMNQIEEGTSKNYKLKRPKTKNRLSVLLATLTLIFTLGFTYLSTIEFTDTDGNPWTVEFVAPHKPGAKVDSLLEQTELGPKDQFIGHYNDGDPDTCVFTHYIGYNDNADVIDFNKACAAVDEEYNLVLLDTYSDYTYSSFNGFLPLMTNEFSEFLRDITPVHEANAAVIRANGDVELLSTDPSFNYDSYEVPGIISEEPDDYISLTYTNPTGQMNLYMNHTIAPIIYSSDQENGTSNDKIQIKDTEVWRATSPYTYKLVILKGNTHFGMEINHDGNIDETVINQIFEDIFLN